MSARKIIAIDQGTTSTRAIRFDDRGHPEVTASRDLTQHYPHSGWVEQDPEQIWQNTCAVVHEVMSDGVAAIGITNQRETILLWDRKTGQTLYPAIVWQDRRTAGLCSELIEQGAEGAINARTGLVLDPYFSAGKLRWLLDNVEGARARAERGELAAGTIDTFLLWRLTAGRVHATDVTNASRTSLYNIGTYAWDEELLRLFGVPARLLPAVHGNCHEFGATDAALFGRTLPIAGMAGDQQSALIGQACLQAGMVKATYGTGCFLLAHLGSKPLFSTKRLLTTVAYRIGEDNAYALEGSIFSAGASIKWLRDGLHLFAKAAETARLASSVPADHGVYLIPAFVGLGAPHWRADLRASITGLTFEVGPAHLVRAALEATVFQTCEIVESMLEDGVAPPREIRIDGGMAMNDWFAQFLADMLQRPVERAQSVEATALGAAYLAGMTVGVWSSCAELESMWRSGGRFEPVATRATSVGKLNGWRDAVRRALLK
ncbi:MAG: glycerol kinase GlpK [Steroidobacteraceae bacterium]